MIDKQVIRGCELNKEYTVIGYINDVKSVDVKSMNNNEEKQYCVASIKTMDQIIASKEAVVSTLKIVMITGLAIGSCVTVYEMIKNSTDVDSITESIKV